MADQGTGTGAHSPRPPMAGRAAGPAAPPPEGVVRAYSRRAGHYDLLSRCSPVPGYPQQSHRRRAIRALGLRPGACVVEMGCGTGLNFSRLERQVGPTGRIIGVDVTDAMLSRAERRVEANRWRNVTLVRADAAGYTFPAGIDAVLATYAHALLPDPRVAIARGAAALTAGGRWVVLDLRVPDRTPRWLIRLAVATVGRSTSLDDWVAHHPWEAVRAAMSECLQDVRWTDLALGTAYLVTGTRPRADRGDARLSAPGEAPA